MNTEIESKRKELASLCVQYRVRRLEIFGSATGDAFDPDRSDLDFLVEFEAMLPSEHAHCYFSLLEALEALFSRPVDLVEIPAIQNPYFLADIESTRVTLYAA
ncbi:MAG: nucleotidyltransferase domain-containing protein [Chloroflexi bacterium]|nr:nucleotidyltransferase domain-containing protein [Chloroflexota bacterium]